MKNVSSAQRTGKALYLATITLTCDNYVFFTPVALRESFGVSKQHAELYHLSTSAQVD